MTDDILAQIAKDIAYRLRIQSSAIKLHRFSEMMDDIYGEAANEIENLRTKCAHLESEVARLERLNNG